MLQGMQKLSNRRVVIVLFIAALSLLALTSWTAIQADLANLISPQPSDSGTLYLVVETNRDVYRPGEIVTMVAILVNEGDKGFNATFGCNILANFRVYNLTGLEVYRPNDICALAIVKIWIPPHSKTELRKDWWDQTYQGRQVPPGLYSVVASTTFFIEDIPEPVVLKAVKDVALSMPWTIHEACRSICKRP